MPMQNSEIWKIIDEFLSKENINLNASKFGTPSFVAADLIPHTDFGAFFAKLFYEKEISNGTLRIVDLIDPLPNIDLYFAYNNEKENIADIKKVFELLSTPKFLEIFKT